MECFRAVAAFTHRLAGGDRLAIAASMRRSPVEGLDEAPTPALMSFSTMWTRWFFSATRASTSWRRRKERAFKRAASRARQGGDARPGALAEGGQHARIDGIGFGQPADALGEMADLTGIYACDRHVSPAAPPWDQLIATGCLDDDEAYAALGGRACELARHRLAVGHRGCLERSIGVRTATSRVVDEMSMPAIGCARVKRIHPCFASCGKLALPALSQPFGFNACTGRSGIKLRSDLTIEVGTISGPAPLFA